MLHHQPPELSVFSSNHAPPIHWPDSVKNFPRFGAGRGGLGLPVVIIEICIWTLLSQEQKNICK